MTGKPVSYRPSNGTEGDIFYSTWCAGCEGERAHREDPDADGCPIYLWSMAADIGDPDYPEELIEDARGPRCLAFRETPEVPLPLDPNAVVRPLL